MYGWRCAAEVPSGYWLRITHRSSGPPSASAELHVSRHMHEVLFLRDPGICKPDSLGEVAARVFSLLGLSVTEERESSNYEQGHYFLGHAANVEVLVCYSDGAEMPEYPFWVVLGNQVLRKHAQPSLDPSPQAVAKSLAAAGFQVFIPTKGWGTVGWAPSGEAYGDG